MVSFEDLVVTESNSLSVGDSSDDGRRGGVCRIAPSVSTLPAARGGCGALLNLRRRGLGPPTRVRPQGRPMLGTGGLCAPEPRRDAQLE